MDDVGKPIRVSRFAGWQVEILLAAVALTIAVLPSYLYFRDRAHNREKIDRLEQAGRRANTSSAQLYSLKPSGGVREVIILPTAPTWIVLAFDLDMKPVFDSYQVTIRGSDGQEVWSAAHLFQSVSGKLAFVLVSTALGKDDYTVFLKGEHPPDELVPVAESNFRAVY
jgi:hypothetical protein